MIRIAICDDSRIIAEDLDRLLQQELKGTEYNIDIYDDGIRLLEAVRLGCVYDLLYLDIRMDGMDGVKAGRMLRQFKSCPILIYISSYDDQMEEMFEVQPYRFLRKPIRHEKFKKYLDGALKLLSDRNEYFHYKKNGLDLSVPLSSVIYFESKAHLVKIVMDNGQDEYYERLSDLTESLVDKNFILIHQSILINAIHIVSYSYDYVLLTNGEEKVISGPKRSSVRRWYLQFQEKRGGLYD